jgi:glycosyltransferase involved in cell wall biosynthesis
VGRGRARRRLGVLHEPAGHGAGLGGRLLISVLLPAYDAAATLPAALASVARQRDADWECVVVDDGSRDETLAIARAFAARDPRFVVVGAPHEGIVAALNRGLARCRGALVARMDADDWMHRDRLAAQRAALAHDPRLAAVGTHVRLFPRRALGAGLRRYEQWLNGIASSSRVRAEAFVECPVAHPTLLLRRTVLDALRYRDAGWPEDYDLVLRLLAHGHEVGVVPRRLVGWRVRPESLTRTSPRYAIERFAACKAAFLATGFLGASDEYVLWGYGHTGRGLRRALLAHGKRPTHVVEVHPGRLGNRIHGAPVITPAALATLGDRPVVVSVAHEGPRGEVRAWMAKHGRRETIDYVCAA